ncbi:SixA phosphatase family protein [Costertonia aggregata]|uniref:Histidine phosphatase family protein n=1 Tax=Costertonia aggregata TaxID=343403 RepID=A0A7H9AJP4_9FLAO|nr:phosphoglycerate mutase family protein [Costertonia aggregata]QLG43829.1 histidine phosphatase family protein [Costertonia aggregata]
MKALQYFFIGLFFLGLNSCKEDEKIPAPVEETVSTFYLIRHAEKDRSDPENADPELTQKGLGRAMHWAEILDDVVLDAIYSTDYERTSMTAAPTSVKKDIDVTYYTPAQIDIEEFKKTHAGQNVLIVGHSNTTPDFVNKLLGEEKYSPMEDDDNGSLFIVQLVGDKAFDTRLRFNCNCIQNP